MENLTTPLDQKRFYFENLLEEPGAEWDKMCIPQDEKIKEGYREVLWSDVLSARENPFPNSLAEANPDMPAPHEEFDARIHQQVYREKLDEYKFDPGDQQRHFFAGDADIGYKLRLNVAIADIENVANYLKEKKLVHKFLSGADGNGQVFTVYTGSKDRTDAAATILSEDLAVFLKKPVGTKELEFAPNVVGYFASPPNPYGVIKDPGVYFSRYPSFKRGIRGIPTMSTFDNMPDLGDRKAYDIAYDYLSISYGTYFYGSKQVSLTFDEILKQKLNMEEPKSKLGFDDFLKSKLRRQ